MLLLIVIDVDVLVFVIEEKFFKRFNCFLSHLKLKNERKCLMNNFRKKSHTIKNDRLNKQQLEAKVNMKINFFPFFFNKKMHTIKICQNK